MNVAVEEVSPCRKKLTIEVPEEKVSATYRSVLAEYTKQARIKGFRPGKAPAKVVAARFKKQIQDDLHDQLVPEGYRDALRQEGLNPVAIIDVERNEIDPERAYTFAVTCDVAPDIDLPTYRGLALTSERGEVSDEDIDRAISRMMDQFATFDDSNHAIRNEDLVQVDFSGRIGDQLVSELAPSLEGMGQATDFWMQAGSQAFLPEIGEAVIGAAPGDTRRVEVDFPNDFAAEELRGRQAVYDVTIKGARVKKVPDLGAEHLEKLGLESEAQLRDRVRQDLEQQAAWIERRQLRDQVVRLLLEASRFDLPASVVEDETRNTIYEMVQSISRQGTSEEQIRDRKDELFEVASRSAQENVRARFILAAIAKEEGIAVEPEEVEGRIQQMAMRYRRSPDELRSELKSRNQLANVEHDVRFEKTLDHIIQHANVEHPS